jgi:hypothetical protein
MFKSILYLIGKTEKSCIKNFKLKNSRILNIFIGSEIAESSQLSLTKNRIENDRLDDEKPSNQINGSPNLLRHPVYRKIGTSFYKSSIDQHYPKNNLDTFPGSQVSRIINGYNKNVGRVAIKYKQEECLLVAKYVTCVYL